MAHGIRLVAGAVVLIVAAGCGLTGKQQTPVAAPQVVTTTAAPTVAATTPEPPPTVPPTTTGPTRKPTPRATTPTEDPNNFQPPACATREGRAVSKKAAKAALNAAAAKHYWPKSAPDLVVPADLVRSIAWHESGWTSNFVNCDGGRGLMQVMPTTVEMMNNNFAQSYDPTDYRQNAMIGANYLAWLTKYVGDLYFAKNYNLSSSKCKSDSSWCLLNLVIAGYQAGPGAVEDAGATRKVPNGQYVDTVRALMRSCYCDRY